MTASRQPPTCYPPPVGRNGSLAAHSVAGDRRGDPESARGAIRPLWEVERDAIESAIAACDGNVSKAAAMLEISASTIYRKKQAWEVAAE